MPSAARFKGGRGAVPVRRQPREPQWFLDVEYWGDTGEVIPFVHYGEARRRYDELRALARDQEQRWVAAADADQLPRDEYGHAVHASDEICSLELMDVNGLRVAGGSSDGDWRTDALATARLWPEKPFVLGKYRLQWSGEGSDEDYIRVPVGGASDGQGIAP